MLVAHQTASKMETLEPASCHNLNWLQRQGEQKLYRSLGMLLRPGAHGESRHEGNQQEKEYLVRFFHYRLLFTQVVLPYFG